MITRGFNRAMAFVYNGQDVEVRLQGAQTVDFTTAGASITRTYTGVTIKSLVGPEVKAKEGHTREFAFLTAEYPENPPLTTTRVVFDNLIYEIVDYTTDGVVTKVYTRRP
jgi:hypothetical protein